MRKTLMAAAIVAGALVAIAADCHDECCAGCCAHRSQNMKVGKLITGGAKLYAGGQTEPFARVEPPSEDLVYRYRVVPGVPFVLIDVAPGVKGRDRTVGRLDLPRITLSPFAVKPKAMSNAGLTEVDGHSGALGYVAVAEPFSRRGVVAGWLTNERASGVVASGFAEDGRVVLSPFAEYGRMLVREGAEVGTDTFAIGYFDDCRLGLEAYAETAARVAKVQLPPQIAGYTTWYPDRYDKGPKAASNLYFFNGRMWYNDPDPVYVRNVVPLGRARTFASFTALAGALYNFSDWLPDLAPARVEILKRTLAPHGVKTARPIDYFEESLPKAWIVGDGEVRVLGIYNWNTNAAFHVDYPCDYAGLDGAKTYVAFDFWGDRFCLPFKERLQLEVPADDCRVLAVREFDGTKPVLVSTSRHVASPLMDVSDERWEASAKTLCGRSKCVVGETYELRLWVPEGLKCVSAGTGRVQDCGRELRVKFDPSCDTLDWKLVFGD